MNLSGCVNAYGAAVSPGFTPISGAAASIAGEAGGTAEVEQARRIREASALIRTQLTKIVLLLEKEKTALENVQGEIVRGSRDTELAQWDVGFADPSPILAAQLGQLVCNFSRPIISITLRHCRQPAELLSGMPLD